MQRGLCSLKLLYKSGRNGRSALGTLISKDAMAAKMSLKKVNLRSFNVYRDYSYPLTLSDSPEVVIVFFDVFVAVASSDLKVPIA